MGRKRNTESVDCSTVHPHFETMLWVEEPTPEETSPRVGEIALWRRVIITALFDFCNMDSNPDVRMAREKAQRWLLYNERQYRAVCAFADVDADKLRRMVLEITEQPETALVELKLRVTKL